MKGITVFPELMTDSSVQFNFCSTIMTADKTEIYMSAFSLTTQYIILWGFFF